MFITHIEQINLPTFTVPARSTLRVRKEIDAPIPYGTVINANAFPLLPDGVFFTGCFVSCPVEQPNGIAPTQLVFTFGNLTDEPITVLDSPLSYARILISCTYYDESRFQQHLGQLKQSRTQTA